MIVGGLGIYLCSPIILWNLIIVLSTMGFPDGSAIKNSPAMKEMQEMWVWSLGGGNGNPVQYSCWDNPMDTETCWATLCCSRCKVASVVSNSVWPHRRQPTRFPCPWVSPGKNTGVGCHFLLQCMKAKTESEVVQSCLTLSDPMDCSLPGSSVHGIFQARTLEWVAIAFSNAWKWKVKVKSISHVQLLATPWTAAFQVPLRGHTESDTTEAI